MYGHRKVLYDYRYNIMNCNYNDILWYIVYLFKKNMYWFIVLFCFVLFYLLLLIFIYLFIHLFIYLNLFIYTGRPIATVYTVCWSPLACK